MPGNLTHDNLLKLACPATSDDASGVSFSENALVFKRCQETGKARQEYQATQLARLLLPADMVPPCCWGVIDEDIFVSQRLDYCEFDPASLDHAHAAAKYLACLHRTSISTELKIALIEGGFDHYYGDVLRNRLRQEVEFLSRAAGLIRLVPSELDTFVRKVEHYIETWNFEEGLVLGHGDFQPSNLFVSPARIWPVDWVDFGLCNRAYEVMHFVRFLDSRLKESALRVYAELSETSMTEIMPQGIVLDHVIRAGFHARRIVGALKAADPHSIEQLRYYLQQATDWSELET